MRRRSILVLALLLGACATSRDAILSRTLAGVDAAHKVFAAKDEQMQFAIVDAAPTKDAATAALATHRAKRNKVEGAFEGAYVAGAAAALDPSDINLATLAKLAVAALAAVKEFQP